MQSEVTWTSRNCVHLWKISFFLGVQPVKHQPRFSWMLGGLIVVNAALVFSLAFKLTAPAQAVAQSNPTRPSEYTVITGTLRVNSPAALIYILDSTSGKLSFGAFDDQQGTVNFGQPIELERVFSANSGTGENNARRGYRNR